MVKVSNNIRTVSLGILCHLGVCFVLASCLCSILLRIDLVPITALLLFFFWPIIIAEVLLMQDYISPGIRVMLVILLYVSYFAMLVLYARMARRIVRAALMVLYLLVIAISSYFLLVLVWSSC
jgi:hypothetical protein